MACFTAPLAEAIVLSVAQNIYKNHSTADSVIKESRIKKLKVLKNMLYGGSALLAVEHIYHGEIIFKFPFLTAVQDGNTMEMLKEIATSGVAMAVFVTAVWGIAWGVSALVKRMAKTSGNTRSMAV